MILCDYGCGQKAKYQFKNGKWCCSKSSNQCLKMIRKNSESNKGQIRKNKVWNKGKKGIYSKETLDKWSKIRKGKSPWNKGKKGIYSKETRKKMGQQRLSIKQIKEKYPTFSKIEEMRYNPDKLDKKEIQVHCKNHKCSNSKEQGGWFTPTNKDQLFNRIWSVEYNIENRYYYCSVKCKNECSLYGKSVNQLIKQDQINAGHIKEDLYTSEEYQTWRLNILKREDYKCEYCDEKASHVHHSRPQKLEPGFALDPDFGVACCKECHYKYGHKTRTECSTGNLANKTC